LQKLDPHPKGWGYTDKARLRGLIYQKMSFENWIGYEKGLSILVFVLEWLVL
jgi:hypothetical protein